MADPAPLRVLLSDRAFLKLWGAGGLTNSMRWVEMLVSGLYAYELTRSAFAVSLVLMARALPMLLMGALSGAVAESLNRKYLLMAGQVLTALGAITIAVLSALGWLSLWHLWVNGLIGGLVWTNELATRRRMVAETAGPERIVPAVAFDTTTGSTTRMLGPMLGGVLYETLGVTVAYIIASVIYLVALGLVSTVSYSQPRRALVPRRLFAEVAEALRFALAHPALRAVLGVTLVMNIFGFSYNSILPAFGARAIEIGFLAAAEPLGALISGLALALRRGPQAGRGLLLLGSTAFLTVLALAALAPSLWLAALFLMLGGFGTAAFASLQTGIVMMEAPVEARSRILGLTTTCIGTGPIGVLVLGALADGIGPPFAIAGFALLGLFFLALVAFATKR
jgi:MFS family permease